MAFCSTEGFKERSGENSVAAGCESYASELKEGRKLCLKAYSHEVSRHHTSEPRRAKPGL